MSSLRVDLDATLWDEPTTGIALYTRQLHKALSDMGTVDLGRVGATRTGEAPRKKASRTLYTLAELPSVLSARAPDVFHAVANFNLPLLRSPATRFVLTVHDVIPLVLPQTVSTSYRWQFRLWLSRSLQLADEVLCISETTKRDLLRFFPEVEGKTTVALNGVEHVGNVLPPDDAERRTLEAMRLPEQYVLYAGALDARKNVELVLEACARLRRGGRPVTLVLLGQRWFGAGNVEAKVADLQAEGLDVRPVGFQPDAVFYELIRRASVFVFPSRYEGFGLPPLEAMWLGTPTIVSNVSSLPEVCGDGAWQVDPDDAPGLAGRIETLLTSTKEREALVAKGRARARALTWKQSAEKVLAAYRRATSRGR